MKTASYLRIFIASVTMTAIACSDPIDVDTGPGPSPGPTDHGEYHTSVMTWVRNDGGNLIGLVTETPDTDLSTVDVLVVNNGKRIPVYRELDMTSAQTSLGKYGEYYWASHENNVLLLHYIGKTVESPPPFPLEVIIVY